MRVSVSLSLSPFANKYETYTLYSTLARIAQRNCGECRRVDEALGRRPSLMRNTMTAIFLHTSWMNFADQSHRRPTAKRVAVLRRAPSTAPAAADTLRRRASRPHRPRESARSTTSMRPPTLSAGIRQPVTCRIFNVSNKRVAAARITGGIVQRRRL